MKKLFKLNFQSFEELFQFIGDFASSNGLNEKLHFQIDLVVEEMFSNMVKYDHKINGDVQLELTMIDDKVIITFTDFNVKPFDPTKIKHYDISQNLRDRPVGKLGLHIVNQIVDKIEYKYLNNNSIIRLIKHTGSVNVRN